MNIIVAVDENWAIGYRGDLLVRIPADHKMFRNETIGKVVVLGRKTMDTFPGCLLYTSFSALAHSNVNVKMIDQGSSELNIIIGVRNEDFETAIRAIYNMFVLVQI